LKNTIGKILFKKVFAWYIVVATLLTIFQIHKGYTTQKTFMDNSLKSTAKIFSTSLENSVWNLDEKQISSNAHTITSLEDIIGISIIEESGSVLALSGTIDIKIKKSGILLLKKRV